MLLRKGATFTVLNKANFFAQSTVFTEGMLLGKGATFTVLNKAKFFFTKYWLYKGMFKEDLAADTFKQIKQEQNRKEFTCVCRVCVLLCHNF